MCLSTGGLGWRHREDTRGKGKATPSAEPLRQQIKESLHLQKQVEDRSLSGHRSRDNLAKSWVWDVWPSEPRERIQMLTAVGYSCLRKLVHGLWKVRSPSSDLWVRWHSCGFLSLPKFLSRTTFTICSKVLENIIKTNILHQARFSQNLLRLFSLLYYGCATAVSMCF